LRPKAVALAAWALSHPWEYSNVGLFNKGDTQCILNRYSNSKCVSDLDTKWSITHNWNFVDQLGSNFTTLNIFLFTNEAEYMVLVQRRNLVERSHYWYKIFAKGCYCLL